MKELIIHSRYKILCFSDFETLQYEVNDFIETVESKHDHFNLVDIQFSIEKPMLDAGEKERVFFAAITYEIGERL